MIQGFSGKFSDFCVFSAKLPISPYAIRLFQKKSLILHFFEIFAGFPLRHNAFSAKIRRFRFFPKNRLFSLMA